MAKTTNIDWTHKNITINDVRKLNKLYVLKLEDNTLGIDSPLFVKDNIFEERLKSYFLKDIINITREEILSVKWNMYITKNYYIKINEKNEIVKHDQYYTNRWYISFLEIAGPLGEFSSVYKRDEYVPKTNIKNI